MPGFDQAAIDGYAVRSVDVARRDGEIVLPVMAVIEAGSRTPSRLQPKQTARVQTGAPMPTLADAVLPLRWTDGGQSRVQVLRGVRSGAYVRRTGDDVQPGDVAVRAGAIIGAAQVGLLAAVGRERVLVHPRPRVTVMSVGGELVDISRTPGQRPGVRRELLRAGRRRPRCRRGGEPDRDRQHRAQELPMSSRANSTAPKWW